MIKIESQEREVIRWSSYINGWRNVYSRRDMK